MGPGKLRVNNGDLSSAYIKKNNTEKPETDGTKNATNPALSGPTTADRLVAYRSSLDRQVNEQRSEVETSSQAADDNSDLPQTGSENETTCPAAEAYLENPNNDKHNLLDCLLTPPWLPASNEHADDLTDPLVLLPTLSDPPPCDRHAYTADDMVNQAREDYARPGYTHHSNDVLLTLMAQHADHPEYLSAMVGLANKDGILESFVNESPSNLFSQTEGQYHFNDNMMNRRREAFITGIDAALDSGAITEQDIRNYGATSEGWQTVANLTGVDQVGITEASAATTAELSRLQEAQNDAQDAVDDLDQELGTMLSLAGPLSDEQLVAFVESFHSQPEHSQVYDELFETTTAIKDFTDNNQAAVLDAAVRDPEAAELVAETTTDLANNGYGVEALELLGEIQADPTSAEAAAFRGFEELTDEVLVNASASAMSQLLAENNGDLKLSEQKFTGLIDPIAEGIPTSHGRKEVTAGYQMLYDFSRGDFSRTEYYTTVHNMSNPIFKAFSAASLVVGTRSAIVYGREGDYANAVSAMAQTSENGARFVVGAATNSLAKSGRLAQYSGRFAGATGFAAKLAPGLGLIANSASFVNSVREASDGNAGYAVAAAGDALGVMGSAMELFPVTAAPGFLISGFGTIISGLGSAGGELIKNHERREMLRTLLEEAGVDDTLVNIMASQGPRLFDMAEALSLSPDELQGLVSSNPEIGSSPGHIDSFTQLAAAHGLEGQDVFEFVDGLAATNQDFANDIFDRVSSIRVTNPDDRSRAYRELVTEFYPEASEMAQSVSPELYGVQDDVRSDFEDARYTTSWETQLAGLLNKNDNPQYQVELIRLMKEDDSLEQVATSAGFYWPESFNNALEQAVMAGVISQSEADHLAQNE
jgi:hypothetical protein